MTADRQRAGVEPFFFENARLRLLAFAHHVESLRPAVGVVMCHPYGEEKQFSYRVLVAFARQLAEASIPVLRFDCRGYGDSEGRLEDATVETQVEDTLAAAAVAGERFGVERIAVLGLRFGATIAALAAERDPSLAGLVLWSPITVGQRYVNELLRKRLFSEIARGSKTSMAEVRGELADAGQIEIEGNYLTERMSREIAAIDLAKQVARFRGAVLVTTLEVQHGAYDPYQSLVAAYATNGAQGRFEAVEQKGFWDDRAMNEWTFPEELYGQTLQWMHDTWTDPR